MNQLKPLPPHEHYIHFRLAPYEVEAYAIIGRLDDRELFVEHVRFMIAANIAFEFCAIKTYFSDNSSSFFMVVFRTPFAYENTASRRLAITTEERIR